jgi:hypothetical protein
MFRHILSVYIEELLAPKLEDYTSSAVRSCLFHILAATFHIWRPLLYPQPEDQPSCGDIKLLMTVTIIYSVK